MTMHVKRMAMTMSVLALFAMGAAACGSETITKSKTIAATTDTSSSDTATTDTTTTGTATTGTATTGTATSSDDSASSAAGGTLDADVGKDDAFVITLQQDGKDVTDLKAGSYTIDVNDESAIHNFHLTGPGGIDMSTDVQAVEKKTWKVDLKPGTYKYVCDPHVAAMNGSFTVS